MGIEKFVIEKYRDGIQRTVLKKTSVVNINYVLAVSPAANMSAELKIERIVVNDMQNVVVGSFANKQFIIDTFTNKLTMISDDGIYEGYMHGSFLHTSFGKTVEVKYDKDSGEYFYEKEVKNQAYWEKVAPGDVLNKYGEEFTILAVAKDGTLFIESTHSGKSLMLKPRDVSGWQVYKGLKTSTSV